MQVFEDNQGCIKLIKSDRFCAWTKHIDVCHRHLQDLREKIIDGLYCPTNEMLADVLTKPLPRVKDTEMVGRLGLHDVKKNEKSDI